MHGDGSRPQSHLTDWIRTSPLPLPPEWVLLLACARTHLTTEAFQRLRQDVVQPDVDWDRLVARAGHHGIAPLLYDTLQRSGAAPVLAHPALQVLKGAYYGNAVRNALLYQGLYQVLQALQTEHIPVIVLKGGALAELVYPHRALRPMSDVDLLIREEALSRAKSTLVQIGYTFHERPRTGAWWKAEHFQLGFRKRADPPRDLLVEIHWHIDPPASAFQIDLAGLWERARPAMIAGIETRVLAPEDLLLHLCLHACRHAAAPMVGGALPFRLRAFCDLAETVRHYGPTLDWGGLTRRAQQWRVGPYVYLLLQLARELLDAAVPPPVLAALQPERFDTRLLGWARAEVLQDPGTWPLFSELLTLWKGGPLKDRAAVVAKLLSPNAVAKAYAISPTSKRVYGYYPRRVKDLLIRYGPVLWRLFSQDQPLRAAADGKAHLTEWLAMGWRKRS